MHLGVAIVLIPWVWLTTPSSLCVGSEWLSYLHMTEIPHFVAQVPEERECREKPLCTCKFLLKIFRIMQESWMNVMRRNWKPCEWNETLKKDPATRHEEHSLWGKVKEIVSEFDCWWALKEKKAVLFENVMVEIAGSPPPPPGSPPRKQRFSRIQQSSSNELLSLLHTYR